LPPFPAGGTTPAPPASPTSKSLASRRFRPPSGPAPGPPRLAITRRRNVFEIRPAKWRRHPRHPRHL